jgi:hypothetical protein
MDKFLGNFKSADGCVYYLNIETGKIQRICDINETTELPQDAADYFKKIAVMFADLLNKTDILGVNYDREY